MAMTTGNEDEVKVEDESKAADSNFTEVKKAKLVETRVEAPKDPPKAAPVPQAVPINSALVFLAQRVLDQPGFEDFKALYPGLFG